MKRNEKKIIERYCPCNVGRNNNYNEFDDNLVEEGFSESKFRYDSIKNFNRENYSDKQSKGDYYNMNGNEYRYNRKAEAKGSPMGIPIQSQSFGNNMPCKDIDVRNLYDKQGYTSEGYSCENYTSEGYIPPLPQYAPLWAPSYINYLSKMPPAVKLSVGDPDNPTSYMYGKNYIPSNVYNCNICPKSIWINN